jgi:hypothetical protein
MMKKVATQAAYKYSKNLSCKMKTYNQFAEDLDTRKQELQQRQREKASDFVTQSRAKSQRQVQQQQDAIDAKRERENMKREIKNELRRGY